MRKGLRWLLPVGAFMGPFGGDALFPLIPTFQAELGISVAQANALITAYMIPFAGLLLISGAVAETLGERRSLELGFLLYGSGAFLVAVSPGYPFMLGARVVQGSGSAFIAPVLLGAIGHQFEPDLRGRVMGLFSVFIALGNAAGPFTGGWFEQLYGWRWFFIVLSGVAAALGAMYFFLIENKGKGEGVRETLSRLKGVASNRSVVLMSLAGAAAFMSLIGAATFSSDFLSGPPLELSEGEIGTLISVGFGIGVLAGAVSGYLSDAIGRRNTARAGFVFMVAGSLGLVVASREPSFLGFAAGLVLMGFGAHTAFTAFNTLSVELVPDSRETASSFYNAFRFLGYGLAPVVLAPVYSAGIGSLFWVLVGVSVVGLLMLQGVRETGPGAAG